MKSPNFFSGNSSRIVTKVDMAGIGIGPSNLSLAALLQPHPQYFSGFFDKKPQFIWHQGMLLPGAALQVSYLKDLVTLVDPTNRFSFINFLAESKRLYQFITANFQHTTRDEFNQYLQWVCQLLPNLHFNHEVENIYLNKNNFTLSVKSPYSKLHVLTKNVVMGIGLQPSLPEFSRAHLCETVFHASNFMFMQQNSKNKRIAIVGAGQSGAEIFKFYLSDKNNLPQKIFWLNRRDNFLQLDESPFVNDLFTPSYSNYFYNLPENKKKKLLGQQRLYSDGISPITLEEIYREIYSLNFIEKKPDTCELLSVTETIDLVKNGNEWLLTTRNLQNGEIQYLTVDLVIFCTGYKFCLPHFLAPIKQRLSFDDNNNLKINQDYSVQWDGPDNCKLYIQNGAIHCRGVADPNLSLMSWRSAKIINSMANLNIYPTDAQGSFLDWTVKNSYSEMEDSNENPLSI